MSGRLAGIVLLAAATVPARAELVLGGVGMLGTALLVQPPQALADADIDWGLSFAPTLNVQIPDLQFAAQATIATGSEGTDALTLDLAELRLNPLPFLSVRLGRFFHRPGTGELASPINYFARQDLLKLVSGEESSLASDLGQITLFYRDAYARFTVAPFALPFILPDPVSPWFPRKDIPRTIAIVFLSRVLALDALVLEDPPPPEADIQNMSLSAEIGASLWVLDLALLYYRGWDNSPLLTSLLDFPQGLYQSYNVILTPVYRRIDAFGATVAAGWGPLRAWVDASLTPSKTFLSRRLSAETLSTETVTSLAVELVGGASLEPESIDLLLLAECKGLLVNLAEEEYVRPMLSGYVAGTAALGLAASRVHLALGGLVSLADGSAALQGRFLWDPVTEIQLSVSAPLFLGALDTELGQYGGLYSVGIGLTWRF